MNLRERLISFVVRKFRKLTLPAELRHMAGISPFFRMERQEDGAYLISWRGRRYGEARSLAGLKGDCPGDAWIVGAGPSISEVDFSRLPAGEYLALNGAIALQETAGVRFHAFMAIDINFVENRFAMVRTAMEAGCRCFFTFRVIHAICRIDPGILASAEVYLVEEVTRPYGRASLNPAELGEGFITLDPQAATGFSLRPDIAFYDGGTVAYAALQVLCFMGAKRIRLLGFDLSAGGPKTRFYENQETALPCWLDLDYESRIEPSFQLAREVCYQRGIELLNATPNSRLPGEIITKTDVAELYDGSPKDCQSSQDWQS